ncbi:MAG: helix-turn-helix transcriptional regulator [Thermodesulfobacteriota bacterium]|nr:helix-turn-helix transcriptional regulator [Thermodesulfobacteriota bacterium]
MAKLQKLLGTRVYELRKRVNLTQAQFAEKASVSNDTISRIERGIRSPSFDVLERIAKGLDVEVRELFNFSNRKFLEAKCRLELIDLMNYLQDKGPDEIAMIYKISRLIFDGHK